MVSPLATEELPGLSEADNPAAQTQHGGLKGHLGTGGGLIEQRGENLAAADAVIVVHMPADIAGQGSNFLPFGHGKVG